MGCCFILDRLFSLLVEVYEGIEGYVFFEEGIKVGLDFFIVIFLVKGRVGVLVIFLSFWEA